MFVSSKNGRDIVKRKNKFIPRLFLSALIVVLVAVFSFFIVRLFTFSVKNKTSSTYIYKKWAENDYAAVYEACTQKLLKQPYNNLALTFKGYAGFYLSVSQVDSSVARDYLDEAIFNLRVALQSARKSVIPQLKYMLGKCYFYKNTLSSYYYYADLAVNYLVEAQDSGYKSDDIFEYLGLSYASLGKTSESIAAFTEALLVRESDSLLVSIAEQYSKAGQKSAAKQYLHRVITQDDDESLVLRSRLLLARIYVEEKDFSSARKEFEAILQKNENSADAHYGLGVVYEQQGDLVRARAEWRKALRLQINHPDALKKISEYK
ncbi:MAG: tetratricopeptide repeat protein [Treponema sp.]|nr:tetratricopeptide repeat protein [Treponema sp.]MDY2924602.1 tetratricopeptide repeat protein [Treponema sp.]